MNTKKVVIGVAAGVAAFIFLPITNILIGTAVVGGLIYGYNKLK